MKVNQTKLPDVWIIEPDIIEDFRGDYVMTYHEAEYRKIVDVPLVEHDISTSTRNVLRGIHYSPSCWKLYQCLYGSLYYVIVNCDKDAVDFGQWQAFVLSDRNRKQILKHPRYGAGFLCLFDFSILHYMQSEYYNPEKPHQETFMWNDPRFKIFWPHLADKPILSQRDEIGRYL